MGESLGIRKVSVTPMKMTTTHCTSRGKKNCLKSVTVYSLPTNYFTVYCNRSCFIGRSMWRGQVKLDPSLHIEQIKNILRRHHHSKWYCPDEIPVSCSGPGMPGPLL